MAKRKSKYEMLVGTEVNGVLVSNYRKLKRTSKSGRTYYRYEVELNEVLWVSTTSFNKGSYGKRLAKAMNSVKTQNKARRGASKSSEAKLLPMVYNPYERDFIGRVSGNVLDTMENEFDECMTKHEVRKIFKKYAKNNNFNIFLIKKFLLEIILLHIKKRKTNHIIFEQKRLKKRKINDEGLHKYERNQTLFFKGSVGTSARCLSGVRVFRGIRPKRRGSFGVG